MYSLVFDTCFNKTYIVLAEDKNIIDSTIINSTNSNYHSVYLIPEIKNMLAKKNILIKDIGVIGVDIGPGSFTGIRAGITIARVLCQQFNIKLIGVPSLKILSKFVNSDCVVVLDARKNKIYYSEYNNEKEITAPCLIDRDILLEKVEGKTIISDASIHDYLFSNNITSINFEKENINLGICLSEIVLDTLYTLKDDYNWAKVKPLYIQPPSVTKPKVNTNV